jgi:NAD+ synthase
MPTKVSSKEDMKDAQELGRKLDIMQETIDIQSILDTFKKELRTREQIDPIPVGNLMPRIRMTILYYYANSLNMLVAGTGNRSELLIGYFTKYGDGGADILPIGGLYKTQVRQLASFLHLPERIVSKKPSAGLWPGQTDEEEIGIDYEIIDLILHGILDLGLGLETVVEQLGLTRDVVNKVMNMVRQTEHKRMMPPSPDCPDKLL